MLQWIIGGFACILLINLVWTVTSLDHSIMYLVSSRLDNNASETIKDFKESWAIRGQMGDILSGHFSALAFLAVAFSIILQNEANRKMQTSIEKQDKALEQQDRSLQQQSKALEVQSESLKAQIEELQQSRKESERQTEEFFIANMNVKLDRYYTILDNKYITLSKVLDRTTDITYNTSAVYQYLITLDFIYYELLAISNKYPNGYSIFIQELRLRLINNKYLGILQGKSSIKERCKAFIILEPKTAS